jgi:hypothetical protein
LRKLHAPESTAMEATLLPSHLSSLWLSPSLPLLLPTLTLPPPPPLRAPLSVTLFSGLQPKIRPPELGSGQGMPTCEASGRLRGHPSGQTLGTSHFGCLPSSLLPPAVATPLLAPKSALWSPSSPPAATTPGPRLGRRGDRPCCQFPSPSMGATTVGVPPLKSASSVACFTFGVSGCCPPLIVEGHLSFGCGVCGRFVCIR